MATLPPPFIGIKETCIYASDLHAFRKFYEGTLRLECFSFRDGGHAFFRAGHSVLLCFDPKHSRDQQELPRHFASGEIHFALETDRPGFDAWLSWLREQGVGLEHLHTWPGGFRSVYFRDPGRHCVEIIETGMWEYERNKP